MRRLLVLEPDPAARNVIREVARVLGCNVLLYASEPEARRAWAAGSADDAPGGNAFHGAILDGNPRSNGFDLARYIREQWPIVMLVMVVDNFNVSHQACDDLGAACVGRDELRHGLMREIGFDGTQPAGLAGKR